MLKSCQFMDPRSFRHPQVLTATFRLLYVLLVVRLERRIVVHWNIPESPTTARTTKQVVEAFPFDTAAEYLLRDRDVTCGRSLVRWVEGLGIKVRVIAPLSPWQHPIVERLIGSIRRECLVWVDNIPSFVASVVRRVIVWRGGRAIDRSSTAQRVLAKGPVVT